MKIERAEFMPITVTIESQEELNMLYDVLVSAQDLSSKIEDHNEAGVEAWCLVISELGGTI